ncbi:MAG: tyrosine-protein phosphatase [Tannerellaceae bacterium]|nr:tyrosine-protein phosphatase [Tannerellaceae bacterium]
MLTVILTLPACHSHTPEIRAICQRDDIGNYIIKWETNPQMNGTMKFYVSDNPNVFNTSSPAGHADMKDGIKTYITNGNMTRKFFRLSFNDKYFRTISARTIRMDSVQNLRDIGGYYSTRNRSTRWGLIYRSDKIGAISDWDSVRLHNLGIKTIIDLRTEEEVEASPIGYTKASIVHIPVSYGNVKEIMGRIARGRIRKGDGVLFMQDLYLQYVTNNSRQFAKALNVFLEKENYPILFCCSLGKDRTGFLSALLLSILDVPEETIFKDYVESNDNIDLKRYEYIIKQLNPEVQEDAQETLTVLLTANESILDLALRKIKKDYGSMDKYLTKELDLTEKQQSQLKDMLLF